jgi:hypothetical protein
MEGVLQLDLQTDDEDFLDKFDLGSSELGIQTMRLTRMNYSTYCKATTDRVPPKQLLLYLRTRSLYSEKHPQNLMMLDRFLLLGKATTSSNIPTPSEVST